MPHYPQIIAGRQGNQVEVLLRPQGWWGTLGSWTGGKGTKVAGEGNLSTADATATILADLGVGEPQSR